MTPKEFIDENYFSLTLDCKRQIEEIYQALEDYAETKQLIIPDVVVSLYCKCKIPNLNYGKGESKKCNKCGKLPK